MYQFSYFKENNKSKLLEFMNQHPFVFLTGSAKDGKQIATQVPVLIEERDGELFLQGHIMSNTDHHKVFLENQNVLAVFTGPDAYVSASWYSTPSMGSTWNYMSVHIHGVMRIMTDSEKLAFMRKLTLKFEDGNSESPTFIDNLTSDYQNKMLPAIDAFEIKADNIDNVFKLSQDRDEKSFQNIIKALEKRDNNSKLIAKEMKNRKRDLFQK